MQTSNIDSNAREIPPVSMFQKLCAQTIGELSSSVIVKTDPNHQMDTRVSMFSLLCRSGYNLNS